MCTHSHIFCNYKGTHLLLHVRETATSFARARKPNHPSLTSCNNPDPAAASDMKQSTTALVLITATSCLTANRKDRQRPAC